ncbi:MAG: hypothetical protein DMG57_29535 [Acidobacteria bacterium]|nr:MAG: hypothetical protein DMG57_29535 [Acidobacteriota bacterium]
MWQRVGRTDWNWLPLLIAVAGWCATLLLCRIMLSRERAQVAETATLAAKTIQSKITAGISTHVAPLEALVARWGADRDPWQPEWQLEATQVRQTYPDFESITWVDEAYNTRWVVPAINDALIAGRGSMDAARRARRTVVAAAGNAATTDGAVLVVIPLFGQRTFKGCVIGVLRTDQWLHALIDSEVPRGFGASISDRNEQLYVRNPEPNTDAPPYHAVTAANVYGSPWVVRAWATPEEWTGSSRMLSAMCLLIGLLIYLSGALAVSARRKTGKVEWAKQKMATQQENLRQANERLKTVIQASPFAIIAMDLEGNVQSWNLAAERIFGWRSEEVIGQPPLFVTSDHLAELREKIEQTASGEPFAGMERRRHKKNGTLIDVEVWTAPLRDAAGSICGMITAMADISEKKKLEEQLRHSQKMEAVGRLAGGVAHDFNNLLTVINGYGHMMLEGLHSADPLRSHSEQILKAGNQAAALTAQLLAFSRRQVIQPKSVDLNHIITAIEKMLRRVIGEDIVFRTALSPGLHHVKTDPNQMEQVLINLAANARDAMPNGGTLTLSTANVQLTELEACELADVPPGSYVEITVSDTGEGMDAETRSHLFEPFFTTKARGKGTGLGLSSVYGSVRQNGGGISVRSEPSKGSTFSIYLPKLTQTAQLEVAAAAVHDHASRGNETILLVEDEAPLRNMLREALASAGYHVLEAGDGSEALKKCERAAGSIDLLLTDVVMPLVNGRELAKRLAPILPHMPVIYMSGYADDVIAFHGILEPGTHLIQKPFVPNALLTKVREVLDARTLSRTGDRMYQRASAS